MSPSPLPRNQVIVGDALDELGKMPDASVDMVLTSPPYFRLRDYAVDGQWGLEAHVEDWAGRLHSLARELRRILMPSGTLWLNLGDSYALNPHDGAGRKSLLLAPERVAQALVADGWLLRNKVVWAKTNPVPTPVGDRLSCTYELLYVFSVQSRYFFDLDAIRLPHRSTRSAASTVRRHRNDPWRGPNSDDTAGLDALKASGRVGHPLGKNPGDVWTLPAGRSQDHHATFPLALAERTIRAGCPERRCRACLTPYRRETRRPTLDTANRGPLQPTCRCRAASEPGLVLDPFLGSGTTALAAGRLGRDWLGIELHPGFAADARRRIADTYRGEPAA